MSKVLSVVLTGGPCGGKSSSLRRIKEVFSRRSWNVYALPEVPTICMLGGFEYPGIDAGEKLVTFETALMRLQIQMEDSFRMVAESSGKPSLLVHDRAVLDPAAYIDRENFDRVLASNSWTWQGLLSRYDLVAHLVTAADGAREFYTHSNNKARTESPEQAIQLDAAVGRCYEGHPRRVIIGNQTGFDAKVSGRQPDQPTRRSEGARS